MDIIQTKEHHGRAGRLGAAARKKNIDREQSRREACERWRTAHPERVKSMSRRTRLRMYGLSEESFNALLKEQRGQCAICLGPFNRKGPQIDHCHTHGHVRGLLCTLCNTALGKMRDDPERLRRAAAYVELTARDFGMAEPRLRTGRPVQLPPEQFLEAWKSGQFKTQREMAAHFGVDPAQVSRWKRNARLPMQNTGPKKQK